MTYRLALLLICLSLPALADSASIKSFFESAKPGYSAYEIRESGDWAFLNWAYGQEAEGQALLHRFGKSWEIATSGGGAFSVGELATFGVPQSSWAKLMGHPISAQEMAAAKEAMQKPVWTWLTKERTMKKEDIEYMSGLELTLMRNEVFATHGRPFSDPYLKATFATRPWYKPDPKFSESRLTPKERANVDLISKFQKQTGKM
jgi:YARHG domain